MSDSTNKRGRGRPRLSTVNVDAKLLRRREVRRLAAKKRVEGRVAGRVEGRVEGPRRTPRERKLNLTAEIWMGLTSTKKNLVDKFHAALAAADRSKWRGAYEDNGGI
jgi:hypothetical protein